MKKYSHRLNILSSIKDEIIDPCTEERFRLIKKREQRQKRKKFLPIVAVAALIALLMGGMLAVLISLLSAKQAPIYTGMTASSAIEEVAYVGGIKPLSAVIPLDNNNTEGNEGNHGSNNKNKKPVEDIIETPTTEAETTVLPDGTIEVVPQNELYYAKPNEDIFITIHFDNPDEYTIMSFKLNGKPYASYMFEYGSDYENIIIKVNVGDVEGLIDYTIDAIQYADRETLKYVEMKGDPTLTIGVATVKQPVAEVTDETVNINDMSFSVRVTDELGLIKLTGGNIKALITDGEIIIAEQELTVGETTAVKFEDLKTSTYYEYAIVAQFDNLSGDGFTNHILYSKEITTREVIAFSDVTSTKSSISFIAVFNEEAETKEITKIELYLGEEKVRDIDITATEFTDLLSNNEYRIVVSYLNKGEIESISYSVKTLAKEIPTVELIEKEDATTQTSFEFDLVYTDNDSVGSITMIDLLHGEDEPIVAESLDIREFRELLSNNEYTVRVTFVYDLNDGEGDRVETAKLSVKTLRKATPTVELAQKGETTQTSFEFDLIYTDVDSIGEITRIELLHGEDEPIVAESLDIREFRELLSNNEYTVRVTFVYDLNDGEGEHIETVTRLVKTKSKTVPSYGLNSYIPNFESVSVNIGEKSDPDNIGEILKAELFAPNGDFIKELEIDTDIVFTDLVLMDEYSIAISVKYNLNDGRGEITETVTEKISTATSSGLEVTNGIISGIGTCTDTVVYINMPIASNAFANNKTITKVVLGNNVKKIYPGAFHSCAKLESITFGKDTVIGEDTFIDCRKLKSLDLTNVSAVKRAAFSGCTSLKSITFREGFDIEDYVFVGCSGLVTLDLSTATSIGEAAFAGCTNLTGTLDLSNITSIGPWAFEGNEKLENVILSEKIAIIEEGSFYGCIGLSGTLDLSNVTSIGEYAFYQCTNLEDILFGENTPSIGILAFGGCDNLSGEKLAMARTLDLSGITDISGDMFCNLPFIETIIFEENTVIGVGTFQNYHGLLTIDLSNVIFIAYGAFNDCSNLENIVLGKELPEVDGYFTLSGCVNLSNIYYCGTEEEWLEELDSNWARLTENCTVYYNYSPS